MANTYLTKTYSGSGNRQKQTMSMWIKRSKLGTNTVLFSVHYTGTYYGYLRFKTDDTLQFYNNSPNYNVRTNAQFKDANAWYHIVCTIDTTDATSDDRIKLYVNGVRQSLQTNTQPSQNAEVTFGDNYRHDVGGYQSGSYFDGSMSHFHFITNTAYQASTFGSTDSTTGEWKINTNPSVTYATNSFFILKDGNSGTDQSGQSNNYSVGGGTLTQTVDNPSNSFATLNTVVKHRGSVTLSKGNTVIVGPSASWDLGISTLVASKGKYYFEVKITDSDGTKFSVGAVDVDRNNTFVNGKDTYSYYGFRGMGYYGGGKVIGHNGSSDNTDLITGLGTFSVNDIIGCAIDLDNNKMYFHENGTYIQNGGYTQNPSTNSYGIDFSNNRTGTNLVGMGVSCRDNKEAQVNFGNGFFSTTQISSEGTNASGIGKFEYDCPTNFTALSTKGLNL